MNGVWIGASVCMRYLSDLLTLRFPPFDSCCFRPCTAFILQSVSLARLADNCDSTVERGYKYNGLYDVFHHRDWYRRRPLEKGRIFEISIYQGTVKGYFLCLADAVEGRLQAARPSLCFWRDSRSRTLTLWHSLTTDGDMSVCYWGSEWGKGGREDGVAVKVIFPCVLWVNSSLCSVWAQPGPHLLSRFYSSLPFADNSRHAVLWLPLGRTVCHVRGFYLT